MTALERGSARSAVRDEPDTPQDAGEWSGGAEAAPDPEQATADHLVGELVLARTGELEVASPQQRLAALDAAAQAYLDDQIPEHTRRAYTRAWADWQDYTTEVGIPLYAATVGSLVGFVRWMEIRRGLAPATVDNRLAGAVVGLRRAHVAIPDTASKAAWKAVTAYRKRVAADKNQELPRGRGKAPALLPDHMRQLVAACPDTLAGLRDRALLLLGWTIGARDSELAALAVHEIVPFGDGYLVEIPISKTGLNDENPVVPRRRRDDALCAATAWENWRSAAALTVGPALRQVDRWDHPRPRGLSAKAIGEIVKRAGIRAQLPFAISGHSLRHGMATSTRFGGADRIDIERQGRWAPGSRVLDGYIQPVDRDRRNAAQFLGGRDETS